MSASDRDLTGGPVRRQLLRVSAPMTVGIFSVLAIGLADSFFLARAGEAELAAVGFVYPVIVAVSAFSVGLSAGANTALSQARGGAEDEDFVARRAFHATLLGLAAGLAVAVTLWLAGGPLFTALGAEGAVLENVLAYLPWWLASFPVLVVTMILNAAFRAAGDGVTAAAMMVLTAVLNIALTPALIFGYGPAPELGMEGAGLGTFIARAFALALVAFLALRRGMVTPGRRALKGFGQSAREIAGVALPAGLSRGINPAGMAAVTAAVATLGDTAVAGFGAASRVQAVALVPFFALAAGLGPVVGQAWGARNADRARAAVRTAARFCVVYGAALALGLGVFADQLAQIMTAQGGAAEYTAQYLRFVGWSLGGYGLAVAANAAMTGRSRAGWAMGLSLVRIGLFYIPLAWVGVWLFGFAGILGAAAIANVVAMFGALVATRATAIGPSAALPVRAFADRLSRLAAPRGTEAQPDAQ